MLDYSTSYWVNVPVAKSCEISVGKRDDGGKRVLVIRKSVMQTWRGGWRNKRDEKCRSVIVSLARILSIYLSISLMPRPFPGTSPKGVATAELSPRLNIHSIPLSTLLTHTCPLSLSKTLLLY